MVSHRPPRQLGQTPDDSGRAANPVDTLMAGGTEMSLSLLQKSGCLTKHLSIKFLNGGIQQAIAKRSQRLSFNSMASCPLEYPLHAVIVVTPCPY